MSAGNFMGKLNSQEEIDSALCQIGNNLMIVRLRTGESKENMGKWLEVETLETVKKIEKGISAVKAAHLCLIADRLSIDVKGIVGKALELDIGIDYSLGDPLTVYPNINELLDQYNDRIAKNICNARINKLITKTELVKTLGWKNEKRLYRLETPSDQALWKGAKPLIAMDELLEIANALELPVEQLFSHCNEKMGT